MSATVEVPTPPLAPTTAVIVPWRRAVISSRLEASLRTARDHARTGSRRLEISSRDKGSASTVRAPASIAATTLSEVRARLSRTTGMRG